MTIFWKQCEIPIDRPRLEKDKILEKDQEGKRFHRLSSHEILKQNHKSKELPRQAAHEEVLRQIHERKRTSLTRFHVIVRKTQNAKNIMHADPEHLLKADQFPKELTN